MDDFKSAKLYKNFTASDPADSPALEKDVLPGESAAPANNAPAHRFSHISNFARAFFIFMVGAFGYGMIEFIFRGYTHWSMMLTGGSCLLSLYYLNCGFKNAPITIKALTGSGVITFYELGVGLIINVWFGWHVWDYSSLPYNFLGQICLLFSGFWFVICFVLSTLAWLYNFIFKMGSRKVFFRL